MCIRDRFITICAIGITVLVYLGKSFILHTVFGKIDQDVMHHADVYLLIVAASIPFLALYNAGAAIFRTMGNSKVTMQISIIMNIINIGGNALLIYGFHRGTEGVAIPTLVSRITAAVIIIVMLCDEKRILHIERTWHYRINWEMVKKILSIGVPNGLENSMFQLGKIIVLSLVSVSYTHLDVYKRQAVRETKNGQIGVLGTEATIKSETYTKEIRKLMPEAEVIGKPCPLLDVYKRQDLYMLDHICIPEVKEKRFFRLKLQNHSKCRISEELTLPELKEDILQICHCKGTVSYTHLDTSTVERKDVTSIIFQMKLLCQRNDTFCRASAGENNFFTGFLNLDQSIQGRLCNFFFGVGKSSVQILSLIHI